MHTNGHALCAAATLSNKVTNQDAFALAANRHIPLAGIIVADGLGSHYGAEVAASTVADALSHGIEQARASDELDFRHLFTDAWRCLVERVDAEGASLPADLDWKNAFGTTAICAVETAHELQLAYAGNGGIFHLRGNFNRFPASQLLPWSALNYLNPHSIPQNGKNAMYKLVSARSGPEVIAPSVIRLSKDDTFFGDLIVAVTDGIYSYDQVAIGRDDQQQLWISGEASVARLFAALGRFFGGDISQEVLRRCLQEYLAELQEAKLVSDDCTVAVLITAKAIAYQQQVRAEESFCGGIA